MSIFLDDCSYRKRPCHNCYKPLKYEWCLLVYIGGKDRVICVDCIKNKIKEIDERSNRRKNS